MFNTLIEIKPEISEALIEFKNTEKKYYSKLKKDINNPKMEEYLEKVRKFSESESKANILNYFLKNSTNKFKSSDRDDIKFYSKLMTKSFKDEMQFIGKKDHEISINILSANNALLGDELAKIYHNYSSGFKELSQSDLTLENKKIHITLPKFNDQITEGSANAKYYKY